MSRSSVNAHPRSRPRFTGGAVAVLFASVVASLATFRDWRLNPGGLFRGPAATHWSVVAETWVSWFGPTLLLACAVLVPIVLWRVRSR